MLSNAVGCFFFFFVVSICLLSLFVFGDNLSEAITLVVNAYNSIKWPIPVNFFFSSHPLFVYIHFTHARTHPTYTYFLAIFFDSLIRVLTLLAHLVFLPPLSIYLPRSHYGHSLTKHDNRPLFGPKHKCTFWDLYVIMAIGSTIICWIQNFSKPINRVDVFFVWLL